MKRVPLTERVLVTAVACALSSAVFSAEIFSCSMARNGKMLQLAESGGTLVYSYGVKGKQPELVITSSLGDAELYAWEGIGRYQNYSVAFFNGAHQYRVFTSRDSISQTLARGVAVEKGDALVAELLCDPKTVRGDLEGYVLAQKAR